MASSEPFDVETTLDELEAEAEHPQVVELLAVVRELHEQRETLEATVENQQDRIDRLELLATSIGDIEIDGVEDKRDKAVMNAIRANDNDEVSLRQLQTLYRKHTDIRKDSTLRDRIKNLMKNGPFEPAGPQRWVYVGGPHLEIE
jgi:uncharacterized Zn finger protein